MNLPLKTRLFLYVVRDSWLSNFIPKNCLSKKTRNLISYLERGSEKLRKNFNLYHIIDNIRRMKYDVGLIKDFLQQKMKFKCNPEDNSELYI